MDKSNSQIENQVQYELNHLVYSLSMLASGVLILMGAVVALYFLNDLNSFYLFILRGLLIVAPIYRTVLVYRYLHTKTEKTTAFWVKRFYISTAVIGLAWGISFFYLFVNGGMIDKVFILVTTAATTAAGAFLYGPIYKTAITYMLLNTLPVSLALLLEKNVEFTILGAFSLLYLAILVHGCWVYYKRTKSSFRLQLEKEILVEKVNEQYQLILDEQAKTVHSSRLAALGEMSAGIAHEINNPMTVIRVSTNMIEKKYEDKEKVLEYVSLLKTNIDRVIRIINSLRKFSRVDAGESNEPHSLKAILKETLDLCEASIINNGIKINLDIPSKDITLECNSIQISQVLLNILNNAKDAIVEENIRDKEYFINITIVQSDVIKILISNNGPKISDDFLVKIFEPFYTSKEVGKGTGLGLSLSKGIIEDHKGTLNAYVTDDVTSFEIVFPT